jgi:hypothetical protein
MRGNKRLFFASPFGLAGGRRPPNNLFKDGEQSLRDREVVAITGGMKGRKNGVGQPLAPARDLFGWRLLGSSFRHG